MILSKLYSNPDYLMYLRYHPKWYPLLDSSPSNFKQFEKVVQKELKITTYDKLENVKKQISFASSFLDYLSK